MRGLVGHWTFDGKDMISNVKDRSGQNNTGYIQFGTSGNLATSTALVVGKLGQAIKFDGVDDYVKVDHNANLNPASLSFFTWVKAVSFTNAYNSIISKEVDGAGYTLLVKSNGTLAVYVQMAAGGNIAYDGTGIFTLSPNAWYYVGFTYDGANLKGYVNGSLDKNVGGGGAIDYSTNYLMIGDSFFGSRKFKGTFDDARLYSRALSSAEIKQLYNLGVATKVNASPSASSGQLTSGLVGWWTFDGKDMISNVRDKSGNGNNGYFKSSVTATSTSLVPGKIGQALKFNGANNTVKIANNIADNIGALTVSFWMKPNVLGNPGEPVSKWRESAGFTGSWDFNRSSSGAYNFTVVNSAGLGNSVAIGYASINDRNVWHHIVGTYDGANVRLYIDKIVGTPVALTGVVHSAPSYPICIGADNGDSTGGCETSKFNGVVDDARIYNRALSASEIKQLYNLGSATKVNAPTTNPTDALGTGLVGWWTFDGKDMISNVKDRSGQNNTGYMQGFTSTSSAVTTGKLGQGLKFDGVDDYINVGKQTSLNNVRPVSYSMWFYPSSSANAYLFHKGRYLFLNTPGSVLTFTFDIATSGSDVGKTSTYSISINKWTHVVVTWNGTIGAGMEAHIYANGVETGYASSFNGSGTANDSATNMLIGQKSGNISPFKGLIDDFRIYNRVLSAAEIKQLYNLGR